jgi:hypothetical protein
VKTYDIELQRIKGMRQAGSLIYLQVDAVVQPKAVASEGEPASLLCMTEEQARVIAALIKNQLLELDKKKAKSRR